MTGRETPSPDAVLHLLDEAGIAEDPILVRAMETIGSLKSGPAPEVTAELARLMAAGGKAPSDRRNKRRITFIGGALAVSMGVGMSGVAAGTFHLTDGLDEAVESIARFSIRDSADRADPLPGVLAGPDEGGGRSVVAPFVDGPAGSLAEAVPAPGPSAEADAGRAADPGASMADNGSSGVQAAPLLPADTAPGAAPDAPAVAGPPAPVAHVRQALPAAALPAARPAAVPPAAVPPVTPAGSAPAPGRERRAMPASGSPVPGTPAPGITVSGITVSGTPVPGSPTPKSPVAGHGEADGPVPANDKADGQGREVRQLKQARQQTSAGPDADLRGNGGSCADERATPAPQGRMWLLAQADGPGHVPSAPLPEEPDQLVLGEAGAGEARSVPEPAPASGGPAAAADSGDVPPPAPTPGPPAGPVEEATAPEPASGHPGVEQPAPGKPASEPAADAPDPE